MPDHWLSFHTGEGRCLSRKRILACEAVIYFRTRTLALDDNHRIPLFDAEKQQKTPVQARRRRNPALQVVDSAWIRWEFRYGAEQRKFGGRSGELNDLTDELQRNLFPQDFSDSPTAYSAGMTKWLG